MTDEQALAKAGAINTAGAAQAIALALGIAVALPIVNRMMIDAIEDENEDDTIEEINDLLADAYQADKQQYDDAIELDCFYTI